MRFAKPLLLSFFLSLNLISMAQVEKYMAAFTYQICKATTWPSATNNFVIGIIGESDITPFFEQMAKDKKIGNQTIKIVQLGDNYTSLPCNVVFVAKDQTGQLSQVSSALAEKPVLIISENAGTIKKGANLCFKLVDNKIRYNLNKTDLTDRDMTVQSSIERMALKVY